MKLITDAEIWRDMPADTETFIGETCTARVAAAPFGIDGVAGSSLQPAAANATKIASTAKQDRQRPIEKFDFFALFFIRDVQTIPNSKTLVPPLRYKNKLNNSAFSEKYISG
jgi:hypothetical protein